MGSVSASLWLHRTSRRHMVNQPLFLPNLPGLGGSSRTCPHATSQMGDIDGRGKPLLTPGIKAPPSFPLLIPLEGSQCPPSPLRLPSAFPLLFPELGKNLVDLQRHFPRDSCLPLRCSILEHCVKESPEFSKHLLCVPLCRAPKGQTLPSLLPPVTPAPSHGHPPAPELPRTIQ